MITAHTESEVKQMTNSKAIKELQFMKNAIERGDWICSNDTRELDMAIEALSAQPERCEDCVNFSKTRLLIPQPEIVRCKDCKYMTEYYDTDGNVPYWTCSEWDSGTDYDGFCHYAERREDD